MHTLLSLIRITEVIAQYRCDVFWVPSYSATQLPPLAACAAKRPQLKSYNELSSEMKPVPGAMSPLPSVEVKISSSDST